jgi:hypothetical protein
LWGEVVDILEGDNFKVDYGKDSLSEEQAIEQAIREVVIKDPLADAVRTYCLRSLKDKQIDRSNVIQSLYQPGDG